VELGLAHILVAAGIGAAIWWTSMKLLRMMSVAPPEIDPADVIEVEEQDFRCSLCGTEVTLKVVNPAEMTPPKHCREEMVAVWRPGRHLRP
jgi:hypothetical protein